jgi:hypothetical protein
MEGSSEHFVLSCFKLMAYELYDLLREGLDEAQQAKIRKVLFEYFKVS